MQTTRAKVAFVRFLSLLITSIRKLFGLPNIAQFRRQDINWELDLTEAIDFCLFLLGKYEPELIKVYQNHLKPGDVVLDIGANIGAHTLPMGKVVGPTGKVYAFEPTDFAYHKILKNLELNPALQRTIEVCHTLLTDNDRSYRPKEVSASWSVAKPLDDPARNQLDQGFYHSTQNAEVISLDEWVQKQKLQRLDAIKLDVDGNEVSVLLGARQTLETFRPLVMVELSPIHFEGRHDTFEQQILALTEVGYQLVDLAGRKLPDSPVEIEKMIPRGVLVNVLAIPKT